MSVQPTCMLRTCSIELEAVHQLFVLQAADQIVHMTAYITAIQPMTLQYRSGSTACSCRLYSLGICQEGLVLRTFCVNAPECMSLFTGVRLDCVC